MKVIELFKSWRSLGNEGTELAVYRSSTERIMWRGPSLAFIPKEVKKMTVVEWAIDDCNRDKIVLWCFAKYRRKRNESAEMR